MRASRSGCLTSRCVHVLAELWLELGFVQLITVYRAFRYRPCPHDRSTKHVSELTKCKGEQ
jgi:hypothetical protein